MFFELNMNLNDTIRSELVFTDLKMQDISVTIDIDLLRIPCEVLDVRFVSRRGRDHSINRFHLTANGPVEMTGERDLEAIITSISKAEGCKLRGRFYKHFVSNSFMITLANPGLLAALMMKDTKFVFDLSHRINSLYLGETNSHQSYEK